MTMIDLENPVTAPRRDTGLLHWIAEKLRERRIQREQQRTVDDLSRLDARLLRDIGIEPLDVQDALKGRRSSVLFNPLPHHRERHERD